MAKKKGKKPAAKKRSVKRVTVVDLKRRSAKSIKSALEKASKHKVAIIVLNAPFKLAA